MLDLRSPQSRQGQMPTPVPKPVSSIHPQQPAASPRPNHHQHPVTQPQPSPPTSAFRTAPPSHRQTREALDLGGRQRTTLTDLTLASTGQLPCHRRTTSSPSDNFLAILASGQLPSHHCTTTQADSSALRGGCGTRLPGAGDAAAARHLLGGRSSRLLT